MSIPTFKTYKVYFSRPFIDEPGIQLAQRLLIATQQYGQHLPIMVLHGEKFQMRDLQQVNTVWKGSFAKLRDDAPHVVAANDQEHPLHLEDGAHIIEKCHFLLRERENLLVWQVNKTAGGLSRTEDYLKQVLDTRVLFPQIMNNDQLDRVMAGQIYELDFSYDRPPQLDLDAPRWNQDTFDIMANINAAHAKFMMRAPNRRQGLAQAAKQMIIQALRLRGPRKIRVFLTDESEPIELFMAPLKDTIRVEMLGRYPEASRVFEELEAAYDRQHENIPGPHQS